MSQFVDHVCELVKSGEFRISEHAIDEMDDDGLTGDELVRSLERAVVVEEYPGYPKGPCVLLLQDDRLGDSVHTLWGIPKGHESPVVLITVYRPDPARWDETFMRRRSK